MARFLCIKSCQLSSPAGFYKAGEPYEFTSNPDATFFEAWVDAAGCPKDRRTLAGRSEVDLDGTLYHPFSNIDDLRYPFEGSRIDSPSSRITYDFDECGYSFATNSVYPDDKLCISCQLPHSVKQHSLLNPHIHWHQEEDADPNWLLRYRRYNNGEVLGAWQLLVPDNLRIFEYTSGTLAQVTAFPDIDVGCSFSTFIDIQIFRDTTNASTLFGGADAYSVAALGKEFDFHAHLDAVGSGKQFTK